MKFLFWEVIVSQSLSSLINFSFMVSVKNTILDDKQRAGYTGNVRFMKKGMYSSRLYHMSSNLHRLFVIDG